MDFDYHGYQDEGTHWPFPDPNSGLEKYLSNESSYMEEFEKWWDEIQGNKRKIKESEYIKDSLCRYIQLKVIELQL